MISNDQGTYYIECDRCHYHQTIQASAFTMEQFRNVARSWGWSFDTEHGDLCRGCTKEWRLGRLDANPA